MDSETEAAIRQLRKAKKSLELLDYDGTLVKHTPILPVNILAEHGAMFKKDGVWKYSLAANFSWKNTIILLMKQFPAICPGSYVEEKNFSVTWHYRNVDPCLGYSCSRKLIRLLEEKIHPYNLKIPDGNIVVEILSDSGGKGKAAKMPVRQNRYDFVLSIGDDVTDEEMFAFFSCDSEAVTIKVGAELTRARFKPGDITEVEAFLKHLAE